MNVPVRRSCQCTCGDGGGETEGQARTLVDASGKHGPEAKSNEHIDTQKDIVKERFAGSVERALIGLASRERGSRGGEGGKARGQVTKDDGHRRLSDTGDDGKEEAEGVEGQIERRREAHEQVAQACFAPVTWERSAYICPCSANGCGSEKG